MTSRVSRGISELTATVLLALIIIAAGGLVLINYYSSWSSEWHLYASSYQKALSMVNEAVVDLVYGYYNVSEGALHLVLSVGNGGVTIDAVYINESIYWRRGDPGLTVNGVQRSDGSLPSSAALVELVISRGISVAPGSELSVKIVTQAGNTYVFKVVARG